MKAYTDIIQSKKLAEILPIESADFSWTNFSSKGLNYTDEWQAINKTPKEVEETVLSAFYTMGDKWKIIPCWSLVALLKYLREIDFFPSIEVDEHIVIMSVCYYDDGEGVLLSPVQDITTKADNFVDAAYAMILKLHEQKIL